MKDPTPKESQRPSAWPEVALAEDLGKVSNIPPQEMAQHTRKSARRKLFLIALSLLALSAIGAFLFYLYQGSQNFNIGLEFFTPSDVYVGAPFTITIKFSNYSDQILKGAVLSLILPDDVSFIGQGIGQRVREQSLGDVSPGSIGRQQSFNLIATGVSQSVRQIEARLNYSDARNPSVRFERVEKLEIQIGEPAVKLKFEIPNGILSGETFPVVVRYQNTTAEEIRNVHLLLTYPSVFQFLESSSTPLRGNNYWDLGSLPPQAAGTLSLAGRAIGPEQSFFDFQGTVTADVAGQTYTLHSEAGSVAIESAPLSLDITTDRGDAYVPHLGEGILYELRYRNNSDITLENVTISAKIKGELFDLTEARTNAAFNSITNTFTWYVANSPELAAVVPGQEGTVALGVILKNSIPIKRTNDKNFTLSLEGKIESPTVSQTVSVARLETKVGGRLTIDTRGFWRDASSSILNAGPFPPRVNQQTQFTVHWVLTNSITDAHTIEASAPLPSGVRWTGTVRGANGTDPYYDAARNLVVWKVGTVPATKGIISPPLEALFQVEILPAVNQVGAWLPLLGKTTIQGIDGFTNGALSATDVALTTELPDDTTLFGQPHEVQP